jgi:hypothetical protein
LRKKKSERGMMHVGGRGKGGEAMAEGRTYGWEKVVGCCVLAVAREKKRATAKSIAAAPFRHTRYC